ncbi:hypothetical protein BpHYR1_022615, partial [Brachionus plicatilis]
VLPELKLLENSLGENLEQDHAEEFDTSGNSVSQNYLSLSDSSVGDENDLESAKTSKVQRPSRACKVKANYKETRDYKKRSDKTDLYFS